MEGGQDAVRDAALAANKGLPADQVGAAATLVVCMDAETHANDDAAVMARALEVQQKQRVAEALAQAEDRKGKLAEEAADAENNSDADEHSEVGSDGDEEAEEDTASEGERDAHVEEEVGVPDATTFSAAAAGGEGEKDGFTSGFKEGFAAKQRSPHLCQIATKPQRDPQLVAFRFDKLDYHVGAIKFAFPASITTTTMMCDRMTCAVSHSGVKLLEYAQGSDSGTCSTAEDPSFIANSRVPIATVLDRSNGLQPRVARLSPPAVLQQSGASSSSSDARTPPVQFAAWSASAATGIHVPTSFDSARTKCYDGLAASGRTLMTHKDWNTGSW